MMSQTLTSTPLAPDLEGAYENDAFVFEQTEFIALQVYLEAGRKLPATEVELRQHLNLSLESMNEFKAIVPVYRTISEHCKHFKNEIYQPTLDIAGDIYSYSQNASSIYGVITHLVELYRKGNPQDREDIRADFRDEVDILRTQAKAYLVRTSDVKLLIERFVEQCDQDALDLERLTKTYQSKFSSQGGELTTYREKIEKIRTQIEQLNKDYEHHYYKAHKEPAMYGWLGLIGAGIAIGMSEKHKGIYRSIEKEINDLKNQLTGAQERQRQIMQFLAELDQANKSLASISQKLHAALPVLQKVKNLWTAVEKDLKELVDLLLHNFEKITTTFTPIHIDNALNRWRVLGSKANNYRAISFIIVPEDQIPMTMQRISQQKLA